MRAAELSIFFGQLANEIDNCPAESPTMQEALGRAAWRLGRCGADRLIEGKPNFNADAWAACIRDNAASLGDVEARAIAECAAGSQAAKTCLAAAEHYERLAHARALAASGAAVPIVGAAAFSCSVALFSVVLLPRFAEALGAMGVAKPALTRAVLHTALLLKVVLCPMLLGVGLLILVLLLYWRTPEGQARSRDLLPRIPWFGELYSLCAQACSHSRAMLCDRLGIAFDEAPAAPHPESGSNDGDAAGAEGRGPLDLSAPAAFDQARQRLAHLSRRMVAVSQIALLILTLVLCAVVVAAVWLPVARLHDSAMG